MVLFANKDTLFPRNSPEKFDLLLRALKQQIIWKPDP